MKPKQECTAKTKKRTKNSNPKPKPRQILALLAHKPSMENKNEILPFEALEFKSGPKTKSGLSNTKKCPGVEILANCFGLTWQ